MIGKNYADFGYNLWKSIESRSMYLLPDIQKCLTFCRSSIESLVINVLVKAVRTCHPTSVMHFASLGPGLSDTD